MRKTAIIVVILFFVLSVFNIADAEGQSNDSLKLVTPGDEETVNGLIDVRWAISSDLEVASTRIFIQNDNCTEDGDYYGDIHVLDSNITSNAFKYIWDTTVPLSNNLTLEDGTYCLVANAVLGEDETVTIEDESSITISNLTNRNPRILNNISTLFIDPDESFSLDIDASDKDGDKLSYSFERNIEFLEINKSTGQITQTENFSQGIHLLNILVEDSNGGQDRLTVILNITEDFAEYENSLILNNPKDESIVDRNGFEVDWTWNSDPGRVKIQYSTDGRVWLIVNEIDSAFTSFDWAPTELKGEYYIRLIVVDENDSTEFAILSPSFWIDEFEVVDPPSEQPTIDTLSPSDGETIDQLITEISGSINLVDDSTFEKIELVLNDRILVTDCSISESNFTCTLASQISFGVNKYSLKITDSLGNQIEDEVQFEITSGQVDNGSESATSFGSILLICLLLLILIGGLVGFIRFRDQIQKVVMKRMSAMRKPSRKNDLDSIENKGQEISEIQTIDSQSVEIQDDSPDKQEESYSPSITDENQIDTSFDPYSIGNQTVGEDSSEGGIMEGSPKPLVDNTESENAALPSSYTDPEELPAWLRDDEDASDPVGVSNEETKASRPLEGTQPYGYQKKPEDSN